eukprot:6199238-Pleurochrysis_carterae.AAC.3
MSRERAGGKGVNDDVHGGRSRQGIRSGSAGTDQPHTEIRQSHMSNCRERDAMLGAKSNVQLVAGKRGSAKLAGLCNLWQAEQSQPKLQQAEQSQPKGECTKRGPQDLRSRASGEASISSAL